MRPSSRSGLAIGLVLLVGLRIVGLGTSTAGAEEGTTSTDELTRRFERGPVTVVLRLSPAAP